MNPKKMILCATTVVFACSTAYAAELYVYPQKGQTKDQQAKDEFECHKWAKDQSGYDPASPAPSAAAASPGAPTGGAVRGAARGAALGAIGGAIAGDAGKGAAIGAAVGGTAGAMRRGAQRQAAGQAQAQAQQQQQAAASGYQRAYSACLEGRGYTVK